MHVTIRETHNDYPVMRTRQTLLLCFINKFVMWVNETCTLRKPDINHHKQWIKIIWGMKPHGLEEELHAFKQDRQTYIGMQSVCSVCVLGWIILKTKVYNIEYGRDALNTEERQCKRSNITKKQAGRQAGRSKSQFGFGC